jgi:hypothetical protein
MSLTTIGSPILVHTTALLKQALEKGLKIWKSSVTTKDCGCPLLSESLKLENSTQDSIEILPPRFPDSRVERQYVLEETVTWIWKRVLEAEMVVVYPVEEVMKIPLLIVVMASLSLGLALEPLLVPLVED